MRTHFPLAEGDPTGSLKGNQLLFILKGANLQLTSDQAFTKIGTFINYQISDVRALVASGGATVACLGGIYTAAAKAGSALIAAAQTWLGLSGAGKSQQATLAAVALTDAQTATPILSLSTGSTGAATADFYIWGVPLDG